MLQDILLIATLFLTRIALPIAVTLYLGYRVERMISPDTAST